MKLDSYTFTAIDFETANHNRNSICQVGLVRVENAKIVKEIDILVQPPDNYYLQRFSNEIHGIYPGDTKSAPFFNEIWPNIEPFISGQTVAAHNISFDYSHLKETLEYYRIKVPEIDRKCTLKIYRKNLAAACREYGIPLNHHDALSDARGCAELYLKSLYK